MQQSSWNLESRLVAYVFLWFLPQEDVLQLILHFNMNSFLGLVIAAIVFIGIINCYLPVDYNPNEETKKLTPLVS